MTVIAGIVDGDTVWMAADTGSFDGHGIYRLSHKLDCIAFGEDDSFIIGTCGSAGLQQAVSQKLVVHAAPDPTDPRDRNGWALAIAESVTDIGKEINEIDSDGDMSGGGLLAWRKWLWYIAHMTALPVPHFSAIGSGAKYALGALEVSAGLGSRGRIYDAARAACRHDSGCAEPVELLSTGDWG